MKNIDILSKLKNKTIDSQKDEEISDFQKIFIDAFNEEVWDFYQRVDIEMLHNVEAELTQIAIYHLEKSDIELATEENIIAHAIKTNWENPQIIGSSYEIYNIVGEAIIALYCVLDGIPLLFFNDYFDLYIDHLRNRFFFSGLTCLMLPVVLEEVESLKPITINFLASYDKLGYCPIDIALVGYFQKEKNDRFELKYQALTKENWQLEVEVYLEEENLRSESQLVLKYQVHKDSIKKDDNVLVKKEVHGDFLNLGFDISQDMYLFFKQLGVF